jgi:hypothetical protein
LPRFTAGGTGGVIIESEITSPSPSSLTSTKLLGGTLKYRLFTFPLGGFGGCRGFRFAVVKAGLLKNILSGVDVGIWPHANRSAFFVLQVS